MGALERLVAGLRQWCPVCQRSTASIECETCGADVCAGCGDHGALESCDD